MGSFLEADHSKPHSERKDSQQIYLTKDWYIEHTLKRQKQFEMDKTFEQTLRKRKYTNEP